MTDEAGEAGDASTGRPTADGDRSGPGRGRKRAEPVKRCDYCRLPIPGQPVSHQQDGVSYQFCSESCQSALEESECVFTQYHGFRRTNTGLSVLDGGLPHGIPRNSFVLLKEMPGARSEAVQAELAWRALQRGEPVVFVSFLEPPISVVQEFVSMEWNVLPALEAGNFQIVDCFTYRVDDRSRMYDRMNSWNGHIWSVAKDATTTVRDPSDVSQLQSRLDGALEDAEMHDRGLVVVDSLTELGSHVQPIQAYNFVKDVRADVCKGRFVPVFARGSVSGDTDEFPHDLGYMFDGIVELKLNEELVENALIKQLRVRKMNGVLTYPEWTAYEFRAGAGMTGFDPVAEKRGTGEGDGPEGESGGRAPEGASGAGGGNDGAGGRQDGAAGPGTVDDPDGTDRSG